jgi:hypothetical protein
MKTADFCCDLNILLEFCITVYTFSFHQAIEDMGFATINKIFLDFELPWWTPDIKGFQLIWSKDNNVTPSEKEVGIGKYLIITSCLFREGMQEKNKILYSLHRL